MVTNYLQKFCFYKMFSIGWRKSSLYNTLKSEEKLKAEKVKLSFAMHNIPSYIKIRFVFVQKKNLCGHVHGIMSSSMPG